MGFLTTGVAGIFFLIGAVLAFIGKKKKGLVEFSLGLSFSVMIILLAFDIVPEVLELLEGKGKVFMYIFIAFGIVMLKLLDLLVPHHDHEAEIKTHDRHLKHIGILSSLALVVHNVIEGIAIYNVTLLDFKSGLLMALGVGLHNIPFGIEITATLEESKKKKKHTIVYVVLIALSTMLGALIMLIFKNVSDFVLGSLMSLAIGMIIYLVLFEILGELLSIEDKRYSRAGLIIGVVFMVTIILIGG